MWGGCASIQAYANYGTWSIDFGLCDENIWDKLPHIFSQYFLEMPIIWYTMKKDSTLEYKDSPIG